MATIGLLWLAALAVIVVTTLSSPGEKQVSTFTEAERAVEARCRADAGLPADRTDNPADLSEGLRCYQLATPGGSSPQFESSYDLASAALQMGAVTLVAAVAAGASLIWTRTDEDDGSEPMAASNARKVSPPDPIQATPEPRTAQSASAAPENDSGASAADSLRRLQALHDEGILTDEEYESKRRALADKLWA